MNLISVEIENFGSIKERQIIKISNGITCLIGLNESGKSTIINAITKLNGESISKDEKNKHTLYKDKKSEIKGVFVLDNEDLDYIEDSNLLIKLNHKNYWFMQVEINDDDDNIYYSLSCNDSKETLTGIVCKNLTDVILGLANEMNIKLDCNFDSKSTIANLIKEFKSLIAPFQANNPNFYSKVVQYEKFINWVNYLPKFKIIKFDNKSFLRDSIEFNAIPNNLQANNFFRIAKVDAQKFASNPNAFNNEEKANIESQCEVSVSDKFKKIFRQTDENFSIRIRIDDKNNIVNFFAVDSTSENNNIPLSKRSDGFNWYFSIYLTLYEYLNNESNTKCILIFDEPNLFLNPCTQVDLLNRVFKEEFKAEQIIYSTHSPYMVDSNDYKSIRIIHKDTETHIYNNIQEYYETIKPYNNEVDLLTPVLHSLQLSVSNCLLLSDGNIALIVEGLQDHYAINAMIKKTNYQQKMLNHKIIPCFGADKITTIYSYLYGLGYKIIVLVDGDKHGKQAIDRIYKEFRDIPQLCNSLITYQTNKSDSVILENMFEGKDAQIIDHNNTMTYKNLFDDIDNKDLNVETVNNFKSLFDRIIKIYE